MDVASGPRPSFPTFSEGFVLFGSHLAVSFWEVPAKEQGCLQLLAQLCPSHCPHLLPSPISHPLCPAPPFLPLPPLLFFSQAPQPSHAGSPTPPCRLQGTPGCSWGRWHCRGAARVCVLGLPRGWLHIQHTKTTYPHPQLRSYVSAKNGPMEGVPCVCPRPGKTPKSPNTQVAPQTRWDRVRGRAPLTRGPRVTGSHSTPMRHWVLSSSTAREGSRGPDPRKPCG